MQRAGLPPVVLGEDEAASNDDRARTVRRAAVPMRGRSLGHRDDEGPCRVARFSRRCVGPGRGAGDARLRVRPAAGDEEVGGAERAPGGDDVAERAGEEDGHARRVRVCAAGDETGGDGVRFAVAKKPSPCVSGMAALGSTS